MYDGYNNLPCLLEAEIHMLDVVSGKVDPLY